MPVSHRLRQVPRRALWRDKAHSFRRSFGAHAFISTLTSSAASTCISRRRPAWRRVALKGDRLRPLRSAQAVAGAPGRDRRARSPGRALPFSSRTKRNSTLCRPGRAAGILPLAKARRRSTAFRDGWTAWRRRASRNLAAPRNALSSWEAGASRSAASRWEAAANPWLGAIARCSRTGSSNPSPSSGESRSRAILPSHGEKPAFRAGVRARRVQRCQQRRVSCGVWRRPAGISLSGQISVRGVDALVA